MPFTVTHTIQAIQTIRQETGLGLKESRRLLEKIEEGQLQRRLQTAGLLPVQVPTEAERMDLDRYKYLKSVSEGEEEVGF